MATAASAPNRAFLFSKQHCLLRVSRAPRATADASSQDASSGPVRSDPSMSATDVSDYQLNPQNAKSSHSAIALAAGAWEPYQVFAIGGIARMLCMMYSPAFASMFTAPFAEYIGQANAVTFSMVPGGLLLLKLGQVIQQKKWHESNVGLAVITVSGIALCLLLRAF